MTFLHTNKNASTGTLNEAFVSTSDVDVAKYLFDTSSITVESLQQLFKAQPQKFHDGGKRVAILKMLATERIIPDSVVAEAKASAVDCGDEGLVNILYHAERFSPEEIVSAFLTATEKGFDGVVKVLGDDACIPDEVLAEGFMKATANKGNRDVVKSLLNQKRIPSEVITDVFISAAKQNRSAVVAELFPHQKAAPEVIGQLFERAARTAHFPVARTLLSGPHVTEEMKEKALITVAERGKSGARKFINGRFYTYNPWTQEALKKALVVAKNNDIVSALRSKLYLFRNWAEAEDKHGKVVMGAYKQLSQKRVCLFKEIFSAFSVTRWNSSRRKLLHSTPSYISLQLTQSPPPSLLIQLLFSGQKKRDEFVVVLRCCFDDFCAGIVGDAACVVEK